MIDSILADLREFSGLIDDETYAKLEQVRTELGQLQIHIRAAKRDVQHAVAFARAEDVETKVIGEIEGIDYELYESERVLFRLLPSKAGAAAVEPSRPFVSLNRPATVGRFADDGEDRF